LRFAFALAASLAAFALFGRVAAADSPIRLITTITQDFDDPDGEFRIEIPDQGDTGRGGYLILAVTAYRAEPYVSFPYCTDDQGNQYAGFGVEDYLTDISGATLEIEVCYTKTETIPTCLDVSRLDGGPNLSAVVYIYQGVAMTEPSIEESGFGQPPEEEGSPYVHSISDTAGSLLVHAGAGWSHDRELTWDNSDLTCDGPSGDFTLAETTWKCPSTP